MARIDKDEESIKSITPGNSKKIIVFSVILFVVLVLLVILWRILSKPEVGSWTADFSVNGQIDENSMDISTPEITIVVEAPDSISYSLAISGESGLDTLINQASILEFYLPEPGRYDIVLRASDSQGREKEVNKSVTFSPVTPDRNQIAQQVKAILEAFLDNPTDIYEDQINAILASPDIEVTIVQEDGSTRTLPATDYLTEKRASQGIIEKVEITGVDGAGKVTSIRITESKPAKPTISEPVADNGSKTEDVPVNPTTKTGGEEKTPEEKPIEMPTPKNETKTETTTNKNPQETTKKSPVIQQAAVQNTINSFNNDSPNKNWTSTQNSIIQFVQANFSENCEFVRINSSGRPRPISKPFKDFLKDVALLYNEDEIIEITEIKYGDDGKIVKLVFKDPL